MMSTLTQEKDKPLDEKGTEEISYTIDAIAKRLEERKALELVKVKEKK
jgi:hypothetical protein